MSRVPWKGPPPQQWQVDHAAPALVPSPAPIHASPQAPQPLPWAGVVAEAPQARGLEPAGEPAGVLPVPKATVQPGAAGPVPSTVPADAAQRIRLLAARGATLKGLPALFSVSTNEFKAWMDADPSLRTAYDEGKEDEREALHRTLYDAAVHKRDLGAAQFLLKTRHGYKETEPEDNRNSVRIVFQLPAAAPDVRTYVEQSGRREAMAVPRPPLVIDHE